MSELLDLVLSGVTVQYGALTAVNDVDLTFPAGSIVGLIGPNGAGKTTLLNSISGFTTVTQGIIRLGNTDITDLHTRDVVRLGIGRTFQTPRLLEQETVFVNVALGCERNAQPTFVEQILAFPRQWVARHRDELQVATILDILGLTSVKERRVSELPYASRRLTELARAFVVQPRVLLLDEPAAGFDAAERRVLTMTLKELHGRDPFTMIVIEHDVEVVRALCGRAVALDSGRVVAQGTPSEVLDDALVREAYFGTGHDA